MGPRSNKPNASLTVPTVAGTFSPLRTALGLDEHAYSSSVVEKIVTATARLVSFADATFAIHLAKIDISQSQVERFAREIGEEMMAERYRKVIEHRRRTLSARVDVIPKAVVVEVDGGRMRTRATGQGPGVHEAKNNETKIACLATFSSRSFTSDPQPEPPKSFECPRRVERLVKQMKGQAGDATELEIPAQTSDPAASPQDAKESKRWSPERLVQTCVASVETSSSFGPMVATEAQERHFYEAPRKAFVADGAAYNWSIHHGYFHDFEPIVDFLHVLCYVYAASRAVCTDEQLSWSQYRVWMRACWQGRVKEVLAELEVWQTRLGKPPPGEAKTAADRRDPRRLVAEAVSYLTNNESRMAYPKYRQAGLPTTSSLVESLVGEFNTRVKSKQKHWNRPQGAESILQLRAALLSEDDRLSRFFANRAGCPTRKRPPTASEAETPSQTAA
jgi:hypothetical protein